MTARTFLLATLALLIGSNVWAQTHRAHDATVGGIAGAVLGGIIGHQNDETPEGALIGGAVGAIAGGLLGDAKDKDIQRQQAYQHHLWQRQQVEVGRAVSINDVVTMSRNGVGDGVILNHIRTNGVVGHVGTHEIISMHNSGVSEAVITAMQEAPQAGTTQMRKVPTETVIVERTVPPRPVVVTREFHFGPRPYYVPPPRVRYATRPAFPTYPSRHGFHRYW